MALLLSAPVRADAPANGVCGETGQWLDPAAGTTLDHVATIQALAKRPVVLLGETHTDVDHHRWQLGVLAALHGQVPHLVLGMEALPRAAQPALDRWVAGELDEAGLLREVDWRRVWGFDPDLYLPLFHFARLHRVPMVALNVERDLVRAVGEKGWAAVPADAREGLGDPAPASEAYRRSLAEIYAQHVAARAGGHGAEAPEAAEEPAAAPPAAADDPAADPPAATDHPPAPAIDDLLGTEGFARFVEGQLTWDRAMAEALATARKRPEAPLVVGIIGSGHLEFGHGVPHQLRDLGIADAAVLLPASAPLDCAALTAELADAVFLVPSAEPAIAEGPPRPRLGVRVETQDDQVAVIEVMAGSVAEAAELQAGDRIHAAAGVPLSDQAALIAIVQRQAPGTWLPLEIERDGARLELVAKFPASPHPQAE
jgi:uncharacterized iron-regulated protein